MFRSHPYNYTSTHEHYTNIHRAEIAHSRNIASTYSTQMSAPSGFPDGVVPVVPADGGSTAVPGIPAVVPQVGCIPTTGWTLSDSDEEPEVAPGLEARLEAAILACAEKENFSDSDEESEFTEARLEAAILACAEKENEFWRAVAKSQAEKEEKVAAVPVVPAGTDVAAGIVPHVGITAAVGPVGSALDFPLVPVGTAVVPPVGMTAAVAPLGKPRMPIISDAPYAERNEKRRAIYLATKKESHQKRKKESQKEYEFWTAGAKNKKAADVPVVPAGIDAPVGKLMFATAEELWVAVAKAKAMERAEMEEKAAAVSVVPAGTVVTADGASTAVPSIPAVGPNWKREGGPDDSGESAGAEAILASAIARGDKRVEELAELMELDMEGILARVIQLNADVAAIARGDKRVEELLAEWMEVDMEGILARVIQLNTDVAVLEAKMLLHFARKSPL